jgi:hypothetical protein
VIPRWTSLALRSAALAFVAVGAYAAPASAHGTAQVPATDYRVEVRGTDPAIAGVHVRAVDDGIRMELRNDSPTEVMVLGYADPPEPYLRIGPNGVFRNQRSPAVFWNSKANQNTTESPPASFDPKAEPQWRRISTSTVARWTDHRAHYLGGTPSGGGSQVVLRWQIPLRHEGRGVALTGVTRYLPPPSPAPYLLYLAVLGVALVLAGRTRAWATVLAGTLAVLLASSITELVGEWGATTLSFPSRIGEHIYVFAGLALGVFALGWLLLRRNRPYDATPLALLAGVALLLASGLAALPFLTHTLLPSTMPATFVRVLVATIIGTGAATVVISAMRLRRPFEPRRRSADGNDQESSRTNAMRRSMYAENQPR